MRWKAPESAGYIEQLFGDLQRGPGASVLSASSGEQFSYESDKYKGGIFTYELLRCMQTGEADVARDGEFHVSELLQCVARHVLDDTQGQQRPTARGRDPYDQSIAREEDLVRSYPSLSSASHEIPLAAQSAGTATVWTNSREITVYDANQARQIKTFQSPCDPGLFLGITADGTYLGNGCQVHFDDPPVTIQRLTEPNAKVHDISQWQAVGGDMAEDGTLVLGVHTCSTKDKRWVATVQIWDLLSSKLLRSIPVSDLSFSPSISVSPDHRLGIVNDGVGAAGWRLTILDLLTGNVLWEKKSQYLFATAFSLNSRQLALLSVTQGPDAHGRIQLLDARSAEEGATLELTPEKAATAVAFAPDASFLAVGISQLGERGQSIDELCFWTLPALKTVDLRLPQPGPVQSIRFGAGWGRSVTASSKTSDNSRREFRIWDSTQLLRDLQLHSR